MSEPVSQKKRRTYTVLFEESPTNWGAYIPDLPGCVAVGATLDEVKKRIRKAVAMHLEGMAEDGDAIPEPTISAGSITVSIPKADKAHYGRSLPDLNKSDLTAV